MHETRESDLADRARQKQLPVSEKTAENYGRGLGRLIAGCFLPLGQAGQLQVRIPLLVRANLRGTNPQLLDGALVWPIWPTKS